MCNVMCNECLMSMQLQFARNWFSRWHRVSISVKGRTATLVYDCASTEMVALNRSVSGSELETDGTINVSHESNSTSSQEPFEVKTQMASISVRL